MWIHEDPFDWFNKLRENLVWAALLEPGMRTYSGSTSRTLQEELTSTAS